MTLVGLQGVHGAGLVLLSAANTFSAVAGAVSCTTPPSPRALATASFMASNTLIKAKAELNNALARLLPKDA